LLAGPSAFPAPGRERVLVVAVEERGEGGALLELRERCFEAAGMACVSLPEEGRPFHPHVTLARVRPERSGRRPRVPQRYYAQDFGIEWQPSSAAWVESCGGGGGYRVAAEFPLGAAGGS
jgi:2'-5' RNA ligase